MTTARSALPPEEIELRRVYVSNAIASVQMEGLEVSPEARADLELVARGEISIEEAIRRIDERVEGIRGRGGPS